MARCAQRALPAETKVESGTTQSKSGPSVNLSNSGILAALNPDALAVFPVTQVNRGSTFALRRSTLGKSGLTFRRSTGFGFGIGSGLGFRVQGLGV